MGIHHDIELQIRHQAKGTAASDSVQTSYVSLLFSVEDYDRSVTEQQNSTVQRFFNHLKFDDHGEPVVDLIGYGNLMSIVDFNSRWVYLGSETFPPCKMNVYWNVINKIFPIKIEQMALFKKMMEAKGLGSGNNRAL